MKKSLLLVALVALFAAQAFAGAHIVVNNLDPAGVGFNDPTAATPVGGNPGTTLGQQRMNAFKYAGMLWGARITSTVPIVVNATFGALACTSFSGTLGSAGPATISYFP